MANLDDLSPAGLQNLIKEAQVKIEKKQNAVPKEVVAQIKELAVSIDVADEIIDVKGKSKRSASGVEAKYQNPGNPDVLWTGRGLAPKWLKSLIDAGHHKDELLIDKKVVADK